MKENNIKPHLNPRAAREPAGMFVEGSFKSPLMLIPDKTPVALGKNTPKTVKKFCPLEKAGAAFFSMLSVLYPVKPAAVRENKQEEVLAVGWVYSAAPSQEKFAEY